MTHEERLAIAISKIKLILEITDNKELEKPISDVLVEFSEGLKKETLLKTTKRTSRIIKKMQKLSKEEKLEFFKEMANQNKTDKRFKVSRYKRMRKVKNKLTSNQCYICGEDAYCMHHIIPLIFGGNNRKGNLIPICKECHKQIHEFMK